VTPRREPYRRRSGNFQTRRREDSLGDVPKIDARTVAEHHDLHHAKLVAAALDHVAAHGVESLTLAALAKRTGRSRASLYAYFGSADDLRATVCALALESWVTTVVEEVRQAATPGDRLDRFVTAQLDLADDPAIDRVLAFVGTHQREPLRTRVRSLTEPLVAELLSIVEALGVEPPTRAATVVQGAVAAAHDQVRAGADARQVADDTVAFVRAGLAALRPIGEPTDPSGRPMAHGDPAAHADAAALVATPVPRPPGALAAGVAPSVPSVVASAVPALPATREPLPASPSRSLRRVARFAALSSAWTAVGFVSGVTGIGGRGLHLVLGLSLIGMLACSVRAAAPSRSASHGLRRLLTLAIVTAAVALLAGPWGLDGAAPHVALATVLLLGSAIAAARALRAGHHASVVGPQPV
jgi:AcrR family transcriptional regulator